MKSKTKIFNYLIIVLFLMIFSVIFLSSNINKGLIQTSGSLELYYLIKPKQKNRVLTKL